MIEFQLKGKSSETKTNNNSLSDKMRHFLMAFAKKHNLDPLHSPSWLNIPKSLLLKFKVLTLFLILLMTGLELTDIVDWENNTKQIQGSLYCLVYIISKYWTPIYY